MRYAALSSLLPVLLLGARPALAEPDAGEKLRLQPTGYLRLEGAVIKNDPEVSFVGRNDGFRLQNARVGVEGGYGERLGFRLSADGAADERQTPNAVEGTLRFALKDAYVDVELAPWAVLRVARFKIVFDVEENTSPSELAFIDRALSSRGTFPTEGYETPGLGVDRNIGLAVRSERALSRGAFTLGYELAAQNGNGGMDSANDNDWLAYSAALLLGIGERVDVFTAGRFNRRTEGELPFRRTEDDLSGALGARVTWAPVRATAQLLARHTSFPTTGGPDENSFGAHGQALVAIPGLRWLEAGYRYAILEPSDLVPSDRVQEHTLGVNMLVERLRMLLQLNYTHTVEQSGRVLQNDRLEGLVQVRL